MPDIVFMLVGTKDDRDQAPRPRTSHSGTLAQDESPGMEVNVTVSQAGQSHEDKGLIGDQTRTADQGFVPKLETWEDLTGWRSRSYRTLGPLGSLSPDAPGLLLSIYFPPTAPYLGIHCAHPILPATLLGRR